MRVACLAVVVLWGRVDAGCRVWRSLDYAVVEVCGCAVVQLCDLWVEQDTRTRCLGDCPVGTVAGMTLAPFCPLLPPLALPGMTHPDANILSRIGREGDFRRSCGCTVACGTRFCSVPSCRLSGLFHPDASIPLRRSGEGCFFGRWGVGSQDCGAKHAAVRLSAYSAVRLLRQSRWLRRGAWPPGCARCAAVFVRR